MLPSQESPLLSLTFNQDATCFSCGLEEGFRVFVTSPMGETFRRVFASGLAIVEVLNKSNLVAVVGGGSKPRYPVNKVMIWDDHLNRCIGELVFKSPIRAVRLRRDRMVVALLNKVRVL